MYLRIDILPIFAILTDMEKIQIVISLFDADTDIVLWIL